MPTTLSKKGEEEVFTYDELREYMEDALAMEATKFTLSELVDYVVGDKTDKAKEKLIEIICTKFAARSFAKYVPILGPILEIAMTITDFIEYGQKYMRWRDLVEYLNQIEDGGKLVMRLDTYYWEAGSGNSYSYYSEWYYEVR